MNATQTISATLNCTLSNLEIRQANESLNHAAKWYDSLNFSVDVEFSDRVNGELLKLLMPLGLYVKTAFLAVSLSSGQEIQLGDTVLNTQANISTYTAQLMVENLAKAGLQSGQAYQLQAVVRVGNSPFCIPSLLRGSVERSLALENECEDKQPDEQLSEGTKPNSTSEPVTPKPKSTRRKTTAIASH
jgi:hypothetical protein